MREWFESLFKVADPHRPVEVEPEVVEIKSSREGVLDAYSETWIFVSNFLNAEIARYGVLNESPKLTELQTAVLRGRIKMAREILSLPDKKERVRIRPSEDEED